MAGVIRLPNDASTVKELFEKKAKGSYAIRLFRGSYFDRNSKHAALTPMNLSDSPLSDPLRNIGFSDPRVRSILKTFKPHLIQLWSDITLAKLESHGRHSFTNCPEAFFMDNIQNASKGQRTPPDWWLQLKKEEERRHWQPQRRQCDSNVHIDQHQHAWKKARAEAFKKYVHEKVGKKAYDRHVEMLLNRFKDTIPSRQALNLAIREAERHFASAFDFPDLEMWALERCSH